MVDVTLPEGLTSIGKEAFSYCGFSTISLPQSLIRIGTLAFEGSPLTTITLPKNVAYLGNADKVGSNGEIIEEDDLYDDVFYTCDLLTEVKVDEQNQAYASVEGLLMTKDMKTLLYIPGAKTEEVVPEGTETIHRGAVGSHNLTTITLPKSLKNIVFPWVNIHRLSQKMKILLRLATVLFGIILTIMPLSMFQLVRS